MDGPRLESNAVSCRAHLVGMQACLKTCRPCWIDYIDVRTACGGHWLRGCQLRSDRAGQGPAAHATASGQSFKGLALAGPGKRINMIPEMTHLHDLASWGLPCDGGAAPENAVPEGVGLNGLVVQVNHGSPCQTVLADLQNGTTSQCDNPDVHYRHAKCSSGLHACQLTWKQRHEQLGPTNRATDYINDEVCSLSGPLGIAHGFPENVHSRPCSAEPTRTHLQHSCRHMLAAGCIPGVLQVSAPPHVHVVPVCVEQDVSLEALLQATGKVCQTPCTQPMNSHTLPGTSKLIGKFSQSWVRTSPAGPKVPSLSHGRCRKGRRPTFPSEPNDDAT